MKVGIITINDDSNYGNRLQNYAVQEVLKSLGCESETIVNHNKVRYKRHHRNFTETINHIIEKNKGKSWDYFKLQVHKLRNKKKIKDYQARQSKAFQLFTSTYISETEYVILDGNLPNDLNQNFDFFVTGSDQVWNPYYRRTSPIDFLTFAPKHKRIAYAASFGVSRIPLTFIEDYRIWLSEMKNLSVREQAGVDIIKKLTGRDAIVLVDPNLMLSKEKWLSISKVSNLKPKRKYLLTYLLGNPAYGKKISKQIALDNNLEVVNLADIIVLRYYFIDPTEFIDLIHSAELILTDSFHCTAFSILLEKPFAVLDRLGAQALSSRLDTLLSTFRLQSRKWDSLKNSNNLFAIDFSQVPVILENERAKAFDYLKEALGISGF